MNDSLGSIAAQSLGDPRRWPALYVAKRDQIAEPNLLHIGQVLRLP